MRLITGSRGPLGYALRLLLSQKEFWADSRVFDLTDYGQTITWLTNSTKTNAISSVFHLAARSGGAHLGANCSALMIRDNTLMAINLLDACAKLGIQDVILVSSTAAYPTASHSGRESDLFSGPILSQDYAYGYAKRFLVPLMNAYNHQYGMRIKTVIVNGIIGPNMNFNDGKAILPAALIKRFYQNRGHGPLEVWGDGTPTRQYSYSHDLAKILLWAETFMEPDTFLNVGSMEEISVKELAEQICRILGLPVNRLQFDKSKTNGRQVQKLSNEAFLRLSNFNYTNISTALEAAISHYLKFEKSDLV